MPPGVYVELPSLFTTASVTCGASVSLSEPDAVALVARSVAVAVLTSGLAVIPESKATGTVKTNELPMPAPMLAPVVPKLVSPMPPVTVPQLALPFATQDTAAVSVTPAGSASVTVTSSASLAPVSVIVTVYVAVPPGV